MTPFGKLLDRSIKDFSRQAVEAALADAGASKADVQAAFFANATQSPLEGQHMVGGQIALRDMGFERLPVFNVENACASSSSALNFAYAYVRGGLVQEPQPLGAQPAVAVPQADVGRRGAGRAADRMAADLADVLAGELRRGGRTAGERVSDKALRAQPRHRDSRFRRAQRRAA